MAVLLQISNSWLWKVASTPKKLVILLPLTNIPEKQTCINHSCERLDERHPSKLKKPLEIWSKHGEITQFHSMSNCFANPEYSHTRGRRTPQPADLALTSKESKNRTVSSSNVIQILQTGKAFLNLAEPPLLWRTFTLICAYARAPALATLLQNHRPTSHSTEGPSCSPLLLSGYWETSNQDLTTGLKGLQFHTCQTTAG